MSGPSLEPRLATLVRLLAGSERCCRQKSAHAYDVEQLVASLDREWRDLALALRERGTAPSGTREEYIARRLKELHP